MHDFFCEEKMQLLCIKNEHTKKQKQHENAKAEMNGLKDYVLNVSWCVEKNLIMKTKIKW